VCPPSVSGVKNNYESGKRSLSDKTSDFEPKSKSLRKSTLEARPEVPETYYPTKEDCKGVKPSEVEGFKKWLESLPRERLERDSTDVKDLSHKDLVARLLSVAKCEPQPEGL
jgi:hypothetical protein